VSSFLNLVVCIRGKNYKTFSQNCARLYVLSILAVKVTDVTNSSFSDSVNEGDAVVKMSINYRDFSWKKKILRYWFYF
jgi:hypothetical protein